MSVLTVHPFDNTNHANVHTNLVSIGAQHSYFFYQQLNSNAKPSTCLQKPKQIIPSIPRKHFKAPKNSSLSPIRSQKVMPKESITTTKLTATKNPIKLIPKRPYPLVTTFSSPASLQTTTPKRQRKVSFDEKVVVVCTIFDEDADLDQQQQPTEMRRHSTGETQPKSILVIPPPSYNTASNALTLPPIKQKITRSLKQFKNRLLFV